MTNIKYCPCGSQKRYLECCGVFILKKSFAKTPEALMRSRYSAFVEENWDYIKKTMRPPASLKFNVKETMKRTKKEPTQWLGLEILQASLDPKNPNIAYVEFQAHYREKGVDHCIHENSEFHLIEGKWYYVNGI